MMYRVKVTRSMRVWEEGFKDIEANSPEEAKAIACDQEDPDMHEIDSSVETWNCEVIS